MDFIISDEHVVQSTLSPGIVLNEEVVLRLGFSPEHVDENGKLAASAISKQDLISRGWSVYRENYLDVDKISIDAENQASRLPNKRTTTLISTMLAARIRAFLCNKDLQAFIVIDDALPENLAHASVYCIAEKKEARRLRNYLRDLMAEDMRTFADYIAMYRE